MTKPSEITRLFLSTRIRTRILGRNGPDGQTTLQAPMKRDNSDLTAGLGLSGIILLGLALRVIRLDFQPLWWDEGYSVFFATRDLATMVARTAVDIHPPLYYALLQAWMLFAGKSDVALRLLSVLIGAATVPTIYFLGRELFSRRVGILAALLLAISPLHVYYSQEVRMYGLVTLLALISFTTQFLLLSKFHATRINFPDSERRATAERPPGHSKRAAKALIWAFYVLASVAALYTQYYAAFALLAQVVVVLITVLRRGLVGPAGWTRLRPWVLSWAAILILYLPWLAYAGPKLYTYVTSKVNLEQYSRLDPITFLAQHVAAFSAGHLSEFPWLAWATLLFLIILGLGIAYTVRPSWLLGKPQEVKQPNLRLTGSIPSILIVVIYLLVPLFCGWLVNLVYTFHPIRYERLLLLASPPFYLLVALGLDGLLDRRRKWAYAAIAVIALICGGSLYDFYITPRYPDEDYRPLIGEMNLVAQAGDVVLAPYPWQVGYLEAYSVGAPLDIVQVPGDEWISQPDEMDTALASIRAASPRTWLLAYQVKGRILEDQIANYFSDDYKLMDDWFGNTRLEYFAQGPEPVLNENPIVFSPDLRLDSFGAGEEPVTAGSDFVRVRIHWEASSNAFNYSLRLLDSSGETRVQKDGPITAGNEIERLGVFIPREVTEGEYDLVMLAYIRASGNSITLPGGSVQVSLAHIFVKTHR